MRAWEIQGKLAETLGHDERATLERECGRRLRLILSMADWEESADQSLARLRADLRALLELHPDLADDEFLAIAGERGLEDIARAAARDLGVR